MRDLQRIETDFMEAAEMSESQRTRHLLNLMNELEQDYSTFIFNPTVEDMERPDVRLYREISLARDL